jgi:hypothetical protein
VEGKEERGSGRRSHPPEHRSSSPEETTPVSFFTNVLHNTATDRHSTDSPCTTILTPPPPLVSRLARPPFILLAAIVTTGHHFAISTSGTVKREPRHPYLACTSTRTLVNPAMDRIAHRAPGNAEE